MNLVMNNIEYKGVRMNVLEQDRDIRKYGSIGGKSVRFSMEVAGVYTVYSGDCGHAVI